MWANGFTTAVANVHAAASAARDGEFDLVILDLGLPGQDGMDALADIRRRGERLPVIVLTARDGVPDRVEGLERGADDYVTKPFSFEDLLARIRVRLRDTGHEEVTLRAGDLVLDLRTRRAAGMAATAGTVPGSESRRRGASARTERSLWRAIARIAKQNASRAFWSDATRSMASRMASGVARTTRSASPLFARGAR